MVKLIINDSKDKDLDVIIKRSGGALDKKELIKVLLFRQYLMFLKAPKSYTVALYKKTRINKNENPLYFEYPEEFYDNVDKELEKAQSDTRWGTNREEISVSKILTDLLINKMLYAEIGDLCKTKKKYKRYHKCDFCEIKKLLTDIINTKVFPDGLDQELEKLKLDKKYLIYYIMLSVQVPKSMTYQKMLSEKFIRDVIDLKINALEYYRTEAQNGLLYRDIQDKLLSYTYADLISYQIRQSMKEDPDYIEGLNHKTDDELRKEIIQLYNDEKEYY